MAGRRLQTATKAQSRTLALRVSDEFNANIVATDVSDLALYVDAVFLDMKA